MTKRDILRRFTSAELSELMEFRNLEQWGGYWDNIRFGTLASEVRRSGFGGGNVPKPSDWFKIGDTMVVQDEDDMRATIDATARRWEADRKKELKAKAKR